MLTGVCNVSLDLCFGYSVVRFFWVLSLFDHFGFKCVIMHHFTLISFFFFFCISDPKNDSICDVMYLK